MKLSSRCGLPALALGSLFLAAPPARAFITFDQRENLNILNSPDVTITASHFAAGNNGSGQELRGSAYDEISSSGVGWFSGGIAVPNKEVFTVDLGAVRNVETFRLNGPRNLTAVTIESSADGATWSGGLAHATTVSGINSTFVLDAPVDTQWLRVTGETYADDDGGTRSVGLNNFRIYGAQGTVQADPGLDLVASTAWTGGNATITQIGGDVIPDPAALTDIADDDHANLSSRQLIYSLGPGDSATVTFDVSVDDIGRVGFTRALAFDSGAHIQFLGSTDGVNFTTVLVDQTGGFVRGPNWYDLATPFDGVAIRFSIVSASSADNRIVDLFVHQVPEPASAGLVALGGLIFVRRRR